MSDESRAALAARFPADLERTFTGRGGRTFTYVPDEAVMDRLDDVLGVGGWSVHVDPMGDACVRVTLAIVAGGEYQDFGYSNNPDSGEPLKEAVSDGIRRVARFVGIARYLYAGRVGPQDAPQRPRPVAVDNSPAPVARAVPDGDWDGMGPPPTEMFPPMAPAQPGDTCREHGVAWRGEVGDLYHKQGEGYHRHPGNTKVRAR